MPALRRRYVIKGLSTLALCFCGPILIAIADRLPVMSVRIEGSILARLVTTGSTTYVPLELRLDRRLPCLPQLVRLVGKLAPWARIEADMLAVVVAQGTPTDLARIHLGMALTMVAANGPTGWGFHRYTA